MRLQFIKLVFISVFSFLLSACQMGDPTAEIKAKLDNVKKQQRGRIEAPPEFREYVTYSYSATLLRSPFQEPIEIIDVDIPNVIDPGDTVQPDITRVKESLEFFGLDSLIMVGTINKEEDTLYALISDGKGGIYRVKPGNHMGRNFGEVVSVKTGKIEIVEIVSDGQGGWVKRPRTLLLKENG